MYLAYTIAAAIFLILSIIFIWRAGTFLLEKSAGIEWRPANALIISNRVEENSSTDSDGDWHTSYDVIIRYEYEAGGKTHESRFTAFSSALQRKAAEYAATHFRRDSAMPIFHHPQRTHESRPAHIKGPTVIGSTIAIAVSVAMLIGAGFFIRPVISALAECSRSGQPFANCTQEVFRMEGETSVNISVR